MKRKQLSLALAPLLAAAGLWLVGRKHSFRQPGLDLGSKTSPGPTNRHPLAPPDQPRRFTDFTPEQRVEFARKGHGPGG